MLHLLAPHICPVCNGPHRPAPMAAAELRPYFGTYIANSLAHKVWVGNSVATTIVFGGWTTVNFSAPSADPQGMGSGAYLVSQKGTGEYIVVFTVARPGNNSEGFQLRVLVNGGQVAVNSFADGGTSGAVCRMYYRGAVPVGQTIQIQGWHFQATRTLGAAATEVTWAA